MNYRAPFTIFLAALTLLLLSSHDTAASKVHSYSHKNAPDIEHTIQMLNVNDIDPEQEVSVTVWSSNDAASRLENIMQANQARNNPAHTHIGINVDDPEDIYNAYLIRDKLTNDPYQLHASGDTAAELIRTYGYQTIKPGQRHNTQ